jgi:hypothetical protein
MGEAPDRRAIAEINSPDQELQGALLPVRDDRVALRACAGRRHPARASHPAATRWRKLSTGGQAPLVVAYLRKGETYAELAYGFGVETSTFHRCIRAAFILADLLPDELGQYFPVNAGFHNSPGYGPADDLAGRAAADHPLATGLRLTDARPRQAEVLDTVP